REPTGREERFSRGPFIVVSEAAWSREEVSLLRLVGGTERLAGPCFGEGGRGGPAVDPAHDGGRPRLRRGRLLQGLRLGGEGAQAAEPPASQLAADVEGREQRQERDHDEGGRADAEVWRPRFGQDAAQARE